MSADPVPWIPELPDLPKLLDRYVDAIDYMHAEMHEDDDDGWDSRNIFVLGFLAAVCTTVGHPWDKRMWSAMSDEGMEIVAAWRRKRASERMGAS